MAAGQQTGQAGAVVVVRDDPVALVLRFGERLLAADTAAAWDWAPQLVRCSGKSALRLDLSAVRQFDTSGVVLVAALQRLGAEAGMACNVDGASPALAALLTAAAAVRRPPPAPTVSVLRAGPSAVAELVLAVLRDLRGAVVFTGELAAALFQSLHHPRRLRWRELLFYTQNSGADAFPIVALICFLMGVIMAFQAAVQLHSFGADIYVADLVGLSITRELGPLMVAIIGAGRSGAAFAAEIGTMKVGEEVDALVTMGLEPQRFLVVPKVLALLVALPCLTLLGDVVGVLGGLVIGSVVLGIPGVAFLRELLGTVGFGDIFGGLFKAVVFAGLIAAVGCHRGLQTGNNAQSVGRLTTSAVVTSIFLIILADAGFSVVYHVMGI